MSEGRGEKLLEKKQRTAHPLVTVGKVPGPHNILENHTNDLLFISFKIRRKK